MVRTSKTLVWRPESDPRERRKHFEKSDAHSALSKSSKSSKYSRNDKSKRPTHPSSRQPFDKPQTSQASQTSQETISKPKSKKLKLTKEQLEAQKRDEGYGRLYIQKQIKNKTPMVFEMYKQTTLKGIITNRFIYSLKVKEDENITQVHKLNIKFLYKQEYEEFVEEATSIDEDVRSQGLTPIVPRSERHDIDNGLLLDCYQNKNLIKVITREGEVMSGTIDWFSKFDIKLELNDKGSVIIFRHAIYSFEVIG